MLDHPAFPESEPLPAPGFSRRAFLGRSLTGTILLGCAGLLARCTRRISLEGANLMAVNAAQFRTLVAFSEAILPQPTTAAAVFATPYRVDLEVSRWSRRNQAQVRQLLDLMENGTRYFLFSWYPFSDLPLDERRSYLRGWESSRLDFRQEAYQALRMMVFFFYYSQDSTWKAIGYDGPWVNRTPAGGPSTPPVSARADVKS